jgi:hypothetical protein
VRRGCRSVAVCAVACGVFIAFLAIVLRRRLPLSGVLACTSHTHGLAVRCSVSFAMEEDGEGDQFMAIKPWLGAIVAPTAAPAGNNSAPDADLSLEWVYGYRCFDARNNVRKLATVRPCLCVPLCMCSGGCVAVCVCAHPCCTCVCVAHLLHPCLNATAHVRARR